MIYLIAFQSVRTDYSGRKDIDVIIDEDYGYFTIEEAARAAVDDLDLGPMRGYAERQEEYQRALKRWETKQRKASKLGFANPDIRPTAPEAPLPHLVVPVEPADTHS